MIRRHTSDDSAEKKWEEEDGRIYLMVGFPVNVTMGKGVQKEDINTVDYIKQELSSYMGVRPDRIKVDEMRYGTVEYNRNFFFKVMYKESPRSVSASQIDSIRFRIKEIVEEATQRGFHANVSIWAGTWKDEPQN